MDFDLTTALGKLPRKGDQRYPFQTRTHTRSQRAKTRWYVEENLHEWAIEQGYLTGAIFKRTKRTSTSFCLLLVGPCPWSPGRLRYYTAPLSKPNQETLCQTST
jgi:hypothetical protein